MANIKKVLEILRLYPKGVAVDLDPDLFMNLPRAERLQIVNALQSLQSNEVVFDSGTPDCTNCELLGGNAKVPWFAPVRLNLRQQ